MSCVLGTCCFVDGYEGRVCEYEEIMVLCCVKDIRFFDTEQVTDATLVAETGDPISLIPQPAKGYNPTYVPSITCSTTYDRH